MTKKMIGRELVLRYYTELWNQWDLDVATEILSPDFRFRGSLGQVTRGVGPFLEYVGAVRRAFPDFFNAVEDVIERTSTVVARLIYTGTHRGLLFGIPPTQRSISYPGVAIFRTERGKLTEGWVVADRLTLLEQLLGPSFWHEANVGPPALEPARVMGQAAPGERPFEVRAAADESDLGWCADLMARSEPWITLKRSRDEAGGIFASPAKECYLAWHSEERVGFVLLDLGGGLPGYIQSVCVVPELRGRAIGTGLIRFAEDRILRDTRNVFLCVSSFNEAAQRLYERLGYERVGELRDYVIPGASEILLRKTRGPLKDPSDEPVARKQGRLLPRPVLEPLPSEDRMEHTGRANGVHYVTEGSGPWITLSHALACDHTMWDPQVAPLVKAGYRVLRFDTRGHGRSDAPAGAYTLEQLADDLLGLLRHLAVGRTHFVGLSLGGMIGQVFAHKHPGVLESLVLCDTSSRSAPAARPMWNERIRVAESQGMAALVESTLGRWFTPPFKEAHPERIAPIAQTFRSTPVAGYVGCAQAILEMDLTAGLEGIKVPSLVMVGEDDPGRAMTREVHDALLGSDLAIIPQAAHLSNVEQPEQFNTILLGFLNRVAK